MEKGINKILPELGLIIISTLATKIGIPVEGILINEGLDCIGCYHRKSVVLDRVKDVEIYFVISVVKIL